MATKSSSRPNLLNPHADKLCRVHNIPALVSYLTVELGWPIHVDDWEDAVYNWKPELDPATHDRH